MTLRHKALPSSVELGDQALRSDDAVAGFRAQVAHAQEDSPVPIPILLDCDPVHDDTIALPVALVAAARARATG